MRRVVLPSDVAFAIMSAGRAQISLAEKQRSWWTKKKTKARNTIVGHGPCQPVAFDPSAGPEEAGIRLVALSAVILKCLISDTRPL
jgi:hypothetical protein